MKKYIGGFFAIALAFAASAFTAKPVAADPDPKYFWFAPDGEYQGERTVAEQDQACPGSGHTCANGYSSVNAQGNPVGAIQSTVEKQ